MAEYLVYGRIGYTTTANRNTAQTQITTVFTNNAANVTAESIAGLPAGISQPDTMTVAFSYRISNETAAKAIASAIATAYAAAARRDPMGYVCVIKVT